MTAPLAEATSAMLRDGRVLLAGGFDGTTAVNTEQIYDPGTGTFTPTGRLSSARLHVAAAVLGDGRVLVAGGQGADRSALASAEIFDPTTGRFSPTGSLGSVRYKAAAATLADGTVLVMGGSDERDWDGQYNSAETYNPATGVFTAAPAMNRTRFKIASAVASLADGRVLVACSDPAAEVFDPSQGSFAVAAGEVGAEYQGATATALPDGRALIAGGYDPNIQPTASTWIYQP
jgi:hypothetical protein